MVEFLGSLDPPKKVFVAQKFMCALGRFIMAIDRNEYQQRIQAALMAFFGQKNGKRRAAREDKSPPVDPNKRLLWDNIPDKQEQSNKS